MNNEIAAVLLELASSDPKNVHLYRFIGGVLYALEEYDRLATTAPKLAQSDRLYSDELTHLLKDFSAPPPNWLRGFFYNAAVMRLDAAWERALRVLLNDTTTQGNLKSLYDKLPKADLSLPEYNNAICNTVRLEVNALKHTDTGPSEAMREKPEVLQDGLKQLLDLLHQRRTVAVTP